MNRLLLSILLILVSTNAYAQSSIEAKTTDGRIVILKSDGTWEYKKTQPSPNPSTTNSDRQSIEGNSLPANFAGHDAKKLFAQLLDLKKRLDKSEFETTAEYEKRAIEEKQKPILDNLTTKDTFALVIPGVQAKYNADLQMMSFSLPVWKNRSAEFGRRYGKTQDKKTTYDLSDVNLYYINLGLGGYVSVEGSIFFDGANSLKFSENALSGFSAEVSMNVEEAKRLKDTAKAIVLVQFEEPYALEFLGKHQFQVRLIDVYFFDPQTGRILAKMSQGR